MEQLLPGGYRVEGTRVVAPDGTVYGNIWAGGNHDGPGADADVDGDTSTTTSSEYDDDDADAPVINYAKPEYWDERYGGDHEPFDWLFQFEHFEKGGFTRFIPKDAKILMLGCGNADFSASLYDWGATNITNIDLSSVVISQMSAANKASRPHMKYLVMDVQALSFDDASFDIVIDKSTMDCLFCCENSTEIVCNMLTEGYRVLKPGGNYISMSLHDEAKCLPYLTAHPDIHWKVEWERIPNPRYTGENGRSQFHHVFVCKKPLVEPVFADSRGEQTAGKS